MGSSCSYFAISSVLVLVKDDNPHLTYKTKTFQPMVAPMLLCYLLCLILAFANSCIMMSYLLGFFWPWILVLVVLSICPPPICLLLFFRSVFCFKQETFLHELTSSRSQLL